MKIFVFNFLMLFCGMTWNVSAVSNLSSFIENENLGDTIPLNYLSQIDFRNDRYNIDTVYYQQLDTVAQLLKENPKEDLFINGFAEENLMASHRLSYSRANVIRKYLIENYGIKEDRIIVNFADIKNTPCECVKLRIRKRF